MPSKNKKSIYIKRSDEMELLRKQKFRCANSVGSNLYNIGTYECILWKLYGGTFDEAGYQIAYWGHNNLQLLCPQCHAVKTLNSQKNNKGKISQKSSDDNESSDSESSDDSNTIIEQYKLYRCERCKKQFNNKRRYEEHLYRISPCPIKP